MVGRWETTERYKSYTDPNAGQSYTDPNAGQSYTDANAGQQYYGNANQNQQYNYQQYQNGTAISLSPVIADAKGRYYKAFDDAQHPLNCSDVSLFSYRMIRFIATAQKNIISVLGEKKTLLDTARKRLEHYARTQRSEERRVGKECRIGCRSRWSPYH